MRLTLLTALLLLLPDIASGCSCGSRLSALEALPLVSAVFDGTALSRTPFLARVDGSLTVLERTEFIVHQAWRGPNTARLSLVTGFGNCDFLFQVGSRYVVFASLAERADLGLTSSICLPTSSVREASTLLADLGPGLQFAPARSSFAESKPARCLRIGRSSLLWGFVSSLSAVNRPDWASPQPLHTYILGPIAAVIVLALSILLAFRRRFRLLAILFVPALAFVLLAFAAQGYLFILNSNLLSHWLLKPFYGA
jgi:hypothetical protein